MPRREGGREGTDGGREGWRDWMEGGGFGRCDQSPHEQLALLWLGMCAPYCAYAEKFKLDSAITLMSIIVQHRLDVVSWIKYIHLSWGGVRYTKLYTSK